MNLEDTNVRIDLKSNGFISQDEAFLNDTFHNQLSQNTIGVHSIDEFKDRAYYCIESEFKEGVTEEIIHENGTKFTFGLLRKIQHFVIDLWNIKDNNVYIFEGFLLVYSKEINDGFTFKGTLSAVTSKANLDNKYTTFSKKELEPLIDKMETIDFHELFISETDHRTPTHDHFFKYNKTNRIDRAAYFVLEARASHTFPIKIVSYCTALECLFTTSQIELSHRISERVATLVGGDKKNKVNTYELVKKAYDVRSKIVHGSSLKGVNDDLLDISFQLDRFLRRFISENHDVFSKSDEEINEYFLLNLF